MTTSGQYEFTSSVTRDQVIRLAMLNIGKLKGANSSPSAQDTSDCNLVLNLIVKQLQGRSDLAPGLKVWKRRRGHLFLKNDTGRYTVGPDGEGWTENYTQFTSTAVCLSGTKTLTLDSVTGIVVGYYIGVQMDDGNMFWSTVESFAGLSVTMTNSITEQSSSGSLVFVYATTAQMPLNIEAAILRDKFNEDIPLRIMQQKDYDALPSKTDTTALSDPSGVYLESHLENSYIFTDVAGAQDVTKHIVLTYQESVQDLVNPADTFDYSPEYLLPLAWRLSKEIAPMYFRPWTQLMEENYLAAIGVATHRDAEISTMFFQSGEET